MNASIGVIGGSGLYSIEGAELIEELDVPTPFGMPSDIISIINIDGIPTAFLPRHGRGHRILPTEVNSKANIWALKYLGVEQIISISAVGSLIEEFKPGDFVICDQLIDRTKSRDNSFFGEGIAGHVEFAEPFCGGMRSLIIKVLTETRHPLHRKGTMVTMEGPLFSTRAESEMYRSWNAHLIGMTALPEAKLAREAEICYATIAMVTDYDCWRINEESVSVEMVIKVMESNVKTVKAVLPDIIDALKGRDDCTCRHAAANAVMTDPDRIPYEVKRKLSLFYAKYWKTNT